jgi:hypothetical protein
VGTLRARARTPSIAGIGLALALPLAAAAAAAHAKEPAVVEPTGLPARAVVERHRSATAEPRGTGERLDELHDSLYASVQRELDEFDRGFVDELAEPMQVPASPFRIGFGVEGIDRDGSVDTEFETDFDATLRLPNLQRQLRIVLSNESLSETPAGEDPTALRAGVRVDLVRQFDFDIGVKLDVPPVAFAALRWSQMFEPGRWDVYPFAKLFAETEEGLGASAALTLDRWSGKRLLRSVSSAKWRKDLDATEWSQLLYLAHVDSIIEPERQTRRIRGRDFGKSRGLLLEAGGDRTSGADFYKAWIFYKRSLRSDWLYLEVKPFVIWERERGWNPDPGIAISFDMLFWSLARGDGAVSD